MRSRIVLLLIQLAVGSHLLADEGAPFSYADVSISRMLNSRPRSREVSDTEATGSDLLTELQKVKARIVTDESGSIVEIQFSELDTNALSDGAIRGFRKLSSLRCLSIRAPQLIPSCCRNSARRRGWRNWLYAPRG